MADPAVKKAIRDIVGEAPSVGDGFVAYDPQEDFLEDVGRVVVVRVYLDNDIPLGHDVDEDGAARNTYHLYFSTSALSLIELARKLEPRQEGLKGIAYYEVGSKDRFSRTFRFAESEDNVPSYAMLRDLYFLSKTLQRIAGSDTTRLAAFTGSKQVPPSDDLDLVAEIISLLEKLGKIISKATTELGKALKVSPKLWDPKERSENVREVIDDAAALLKTVATALKSGVETMVDLALDALESTTETLEELFKAGASAVVDFLSEQLGSLADPAVAAKELAELVLKILRLMCDRIRELRDFGKVVADWFDDTFGSLRDSADVLIGYFSGVWNGLVDAVLGIFDTANMVVTIILGLFRLGNVAGDAWDLSLEILDEILQGLEATEWSDVWDEFTETIYPELRDTLLEQGRELSDAIGHTLTSNNAAVGYYFGYLVYMIVEMFFPPIKLTKVAGAARRSASATSAFFKRLGQFSRGKLPEFVDG